MYWERPLAEFQRRATTGSRALPANVWRRPILPPTGIGPRSRIVTKMTPAKGAGAYSDQYSSPPGAANRSELPRKFATKASSTRRRLTHDFPRRTAMESRTQPQRERLLIFGDDGSADADVAWLWVCNHVWPKWRAEVVTATDPPFPPPSWDHHGELVEWDSPHPRMLVAQSQLSSVKTLTISQDRRIVLGGRTEADLLVIGPGRISQTRAPLLGSTSEWLVHYPSSPTAIVRSASPTRRVLACTDGSAHARIAIETFARLPWAAQAGVVILAVDDGRSDTTRGVDEAAAILRAIGIEPTVSTTKGKPTREILQHLDSHDPQLVVLGTRGLTGWKRLRVGSTAGHIVRAAPCNTLVACVDDQPTNPEGE